MVWESESMPGAHTSSNPTAAMDYLLFFYRRFCGLSPSFLKNGYG